MHWRLKSPKVQLAVIVIIPQVATMFVGESIRRTGMLSPGSVTVLIVEKVPEELEVTLKDSPVVSSLIV